MTLRIKRGCLLVMVLPALLLGLGFGQATVEAKSAVVQGAVCDSEDAPLPGASVSLESADHSHSLVTRVDPQGHYRFQNVPSGSYVLRASMNGYAASERGPVVVREEDSNTIDLHLSKVASVEKNAPAGVQFSDEPQFQIAGISDPSNYGGHGSDTGLRTKEALAKETDSLKKETASLPGNSPTEESAAGLHRQKGDKAEAEGHPLEAVHEYQLAAEMQPSEPNLYSWGAELLLHRAFPPATEVFSQGRRRFPGSVRMAVGLGIATYDRGDTERGEQLLLEASDINPGDFTPYLFMGRLQEAEKTLPPGWIDKLRRFTELAPRNPEAHYHFAVALSKQSPPGAGSSVAESELKKAIELDPKLGKAYLQLGILLTERKETSAAIDALKKAIENLPLADEAHYRLAQIYRQSGQPEEARRELALYRETSQQKTQQEEQRRHEIQQFVYTLREPKADEPANSKPE